MSARNRSLILDTNVLVHLARGKAAGRKLNDDYELATDLNRPIICVVTIDECLSIARYCEWGQEKREQLDSLFVNWSSRTSMMQACSGPMRKSTIGAVATA